MQGREKFGIVGRNQSIVFWIKIQAILFLRKQRKIHVCFFVFLHTKNKKYLFFHTKYKNEGKTMNIDI